MDKFLAVDKTWSNLQDNPPWSPSIKWDIEIDLEAM